MATFSQSHIRLCVVLSFSATLHTPRPYTTIFGDCQGFSAAHPNHAILHHNLRFSSCLSLTLSTTTNQFDTIFRRSYVFLRHPTGKPAHARRSWAGFRLLLRTSTANNTYWTLSGLLPDPFEDLITPRLSGYKVESSLSQHPTEYLTTQSSIRFWSLLCYSTPSVLSTHTYSKLFGRRPPRSNAHRNYLRSPKPVPPLIMWLSSIMAKHYYPPSLIQPLHSLN